MRIAPMKGKFTVFIEMAINGNKDTTFHSEQLKATWISQILLQPDGKIILLGGFYLEATNSRTSILRLNADGSIDPSFTYSPFSAVTSA